MRLQFGELSSEEQRTRQGICSRAHEAWSELRDGDPTRACRLMSGIDERVQLAVSGVDVDVDVGADVGVGVGVDIESDIDVDVGIESGGARCAELTAFEPSAWPLAELMLAQAPPDLGYALSRGRPAQSLARALAEVRESHQVELGRATLRAGFGRGHLLEVTLGVPGGVGDENEQNAAENLVRAVVGDRVFETWIGAVHVTPAARTPSLRVLDALSRHVSLSVDDLFATVSAATLGVLRGLPEVSRAASLSASLGAAPAPSALASREEWTLLEVEPLAAESTRRKDDLLLASTCTPELLRCYLDGSPCASRRFSRAAEQFVFVSYADDERTMARRLARRAEVEAALSECVAGVGAVTGVGFGVKTSYVDLALCDLELGLPRLVSRSRELDLPARSFIQFFDSELEEEWLSIWPDSRLTEG